MEHQDLSMDHRIIMPCSCGSLGGKSQIRILQVTSIYFGNNTPEPEPTRTTYLLDDQLRSTTQGLQHVDSSRVYS